MKRKVLSILLCMGLTVSMLGACGGDSSANSNASSSGDNNSSSNDGGSSSSGEALRLVNGKIEVDAQLKELAELYKQETGVEVVIESLGGGIDIQGTLKGYYQAGNMPDMFVCGGATDFANWEGLLVDMADEKWAADTDAEYVDEKYGTIGFPYTVEAIGLRR